MSKYQFTESDIYLPGTDIPKNHPGIETPDLLHEVDATLLQKAYTSFITELGPAVRFDENYFKALHHDTYESLYEWAGLYRTVDMSKGGSLFCRAAYLEQETRRIFRELEQEQCLKQAANGTVEKSAERLAHYQSGIDRPACLRRSLHPLRTARQQQQVAADHLAGGEANRGGLIEKEIVSGTLGYFRRPRIPSRRSCHPSDALRTRAPTGNPDPRQAMDTGGSSTSAWHFAIARLRPDPWQV